MMVQTWDGNRLLWRALAASLGLHLLLALFLPVWTAREAAGLQPIEQLSFARVARVQIQRPAAKSLPAAVPRTHRRSEKVTFARVRAELTAPSRKPATRPTAQAGPQGVTAAAPRLVAQQNAPLYARPAASAEISTQQAPPAPSPQPLASHADRNARGNGTSDRGGLMPFGETQNPVLDPAVLTRIQKRFTGHVTLIVSVGEDGRTKHVAFQPPLDADTERAIEALLADATWDPAVCGGGVSCEGTATIKL